MPHGPFIRKKVRDILRPAAINELQAALENAPTLAQVGAVGVSPMDHGAVGDGVTNDYAAIMAAITRLGARGGRMDLGGKAFRSNTAITLSAGVGLHIDGGTVSSNSIGGGGGELVFASGINGIVTQYAEPLGSLKLTNMGLRSLALGAGGVGDGLILRSQAFSLHDVHIQGFGRYGIDQTSEPVVVGVLANLGLAMGVRCYGNGSHGIKIESQNSNTSLWERVDVTGNGGYGIHNKALYMNTFINAHAYGNTIGDFYEDAWSSIWINPYSEAAGKFVIGPNALHTLVQGGGAAGSPSYWYDSAGTIVPYAYQRQIYGVRIWHNSALIGHLLLRDEGTNTTWGFRPGWPNSGSMDLNHPTVGSIVEYRGSGSTWFMHGLRPGAKALPAASAIQRGELLRVEGAAGVADALYICEKNAANAYVWRLIT